MIPNAFIQDLLARVDIVEVIGRHVELRRTGVNFSGLCPFHAEKSPSFTVAPSKQFYHCFGCGAHGNAVGFLIENSGMGFVDAVKDLAQQVGMTVPEDDASPEERERAAALKARQATLSDVLSKAAGHYRLQLKASPRAVEYLKGRGLSGEIAARFELGYAPDGWRGLASVFPRYDDPLLEDSGLVISRPDDDNDANDKAGDTAPAPTGAPDSGEQRSTGKRYDRFRDRIMFPIRSVQGEVIGFGGRVLDKGEPKYLNSPETPVFVKGRELYGLYEARPAIRDRGYVLVVEGYMDVVALAQLGFPNAVATLGTACTPEHVQKLFRFADSVVFSFDGDSAGRRAARRALEASLPHATDTRTIRFLFLPTEHDPDSYVRENGAEAFERCVASAVPLSRQLAEVASDGLDLQTAEGRAHALANARPLWSALPDGALKRQMLGDLAGMGRLGTDELAESWGKAALRDKPRDRPGDRSGDASAHAAGNAGRSGARTGPATALEPMAARRSPVRVSRGAANLLDRALWLLIHQCELWIALDGESHDLLAGQPPPYDLFFGGLERSIHDHGTLAAPALLDELRRVATEEGPPEAAAVLTRIAEFHDPAVKASLAADLAIVLDRLRLAAAEDELKLLFESGALSPDAQRRGQELMGIQKRLKAELAAIRSAVTE